VGDNLSPGDIIRLRVAVPAKWEMVLQDYAARRLSLSSARFTPPVPARSRYKPRTVPKKKACAKNCTTGSVCSGNHYPVDQATGDRSNRHRVGRLECWRTYDHCGDHRRGMMKACGPSPWRS